MKNTCFEKAKKLGLKLIPIVTKIDLPNAQPEEAALAMETAFQIIILMYSDIQRQSSKAHMKSLKSQNEISIDRIHINDNAIFMNDRQSQISALENMRSSSMGNSAFVKYINSFIKNDYQLKGRHSDYLKIPVGQT